MYGSLAALVSEVVSLWEKVAFVPFLGDWRLMCYDHAQAVVCTARVSVCQKLGILIVAQRSQVGPSLVVVPLSVFSTLCGSGWLLAWGGSASLPQFFGGSCRWCACRCVSGWSS